MKKYQILFTTFALTLFKPCFAVDYTWSDDGLKQRVEKQSWKSYEFTVEKGKLIRGTPFKITGHVQYDTKGRRVERVDYGIDGNSFSLNYNGKKTYQYKEGQLISSESINLRINKGGLKTFYTYNDAGQKIRQQTKSGDSWSDYHTTFTYDKQGRLIREFSSMYKGNHIRLYANTIERHSYEEDGTHSVAYTRGSIGNILQMSKYNNKDLLINRKGYIRYSSDDRGFYGKSDKINKLSSNTNYRYDKNKLSSNTDYWYDKNGLLIKEVYTEKYPKKIEKVRTYKYTFDKKGNIKTKAVFENDKPVYLTDYSITYFE